MQKTVQKTVITGPAGRTIVLTPQYEHFDSEHAPDFLRDVMIALDEPGSQDSYDRLVFNMEWVRLIDSFGLGAISRCARMFTAGEECVTLCNVSPELRVALNLSQLDLRMTVCDVCGDLGSDGHE